MKFSTRQDIEAPADFVFAQLTDFDALERQAMRRGLDVRRKSPEGTTGVGLAWGLTVPFRGKTRDVAAHVDHFDPSNSFGAAATSGGLDMQLTVELVPLSPKRTRMTLGYEVRPKTISARILVQSVKFAKASLQRRFEKRTEKFCDGIGERYDIAAQG